MKKSFAILTIAAIATLCCAFFILTGCGQKALEVKIGQTTITLEEGFKEMELTQDDIDSNTTHVYKKDGATYKVEIHAFDNPNGKSVEDICRAQGASQHGCVEYKALPNSDTKAWLTTFAYSEGDEYHALVKEYFLEDNESIVSLAYCHFTKEVQMADGNYYMWVPTCYNDPKSEHNDALNADILRFTADKKYGLADFCIVTKWSERYSYAVAVKDCEAINVVPACTEAQFNALTKGSKWTFNEFFKSVDAICGDALTESVSLNINNVQVEIRCVETNVSDTDYTFVYNGFNTTDNNELAMVVFGPTETWPGIAEALAYSVHYKG